MGIHDPVPLNDYLSKSPDLVKLELRDGSLLGSHPAFVRQMAEVGRMANEGQLKFGVSGTEMASDMKAQYEQLSRDIHAAYQSGDRGRTATLSAQRSVIAERLHGTQAFVVAGRSILTALRQPLASHLEPSFLEDGLEKGPRCRISRLWYRHLTLNHQSGAYDYRRCNDQQMRGQLKKRTRQVRATIQKSSFSISLFEIKYERICTADYRARQAKMYAFV